MLWIPGECCSLRVCPRPPPEVPRGPPGGRGGLRYVCVYICTSPPQYLLVFAFCVPRGRTKPPCPVWLLRRGGFVAYRRSEGLFWFWCQTRLRCGAGAA